MGRSAQRRSIHPTAIILMDAHLGFNSELAAKSKHLNAIDKASSWQDVKRIVEAKLQKFNSVYSKKNATFSHRQLSNPKIDWSRFRSLALMLDFARYTSAVKFKDARNDIDYRNFLYWLKEKKSEADREINLFLRNHDKPRLKT